MSFAGLLQWRIIGVLTQPARLALTDHQTPVSGGATKSRRRGAPRETKEARTALSSDGKAGLPVPGPSYLAAANGGKGRRKAPSAQRPLEIARTGDMLLREEAMATRKQKPGRVFVFKVALKGQKRIWRRIAIRGDQTFDDLHEEIYDAFDRYDEHLYSFYFLRPGVRGRYRLEGALEIGHPMVAEDSGPFRMARCETQPRPRSNRCSFRRENFQYLFDFGDDWWHELTVESTDGEPDNQPYPRVIEKKGESPPQYPDLDEDEDEDE
jgi:hypothetical protein